VSVQTASAVFLQLLDESTFDQVNTQLEVDYRQMLSDSESLTLRLHHFVARTPPFAALFQSLSLDAPATAPLTFKP